MNKISIVIITTVLLLSLFPVSSTAQTDDVQLKFQIKSVGFDKNFNSYKLLVNVSLNKPGNVVYIEEFYTIDADNHPKFVTSTRSEGWELVNTGSGYNASFEVFRPVSHGGISYTLVKAVLLFNEKRVLDYWLTKNKDFIDNTGTGDDDNSLLSDVQNLDIYETREKSIATGSPVLFSYSSLGVISEINVTGTANADVALRVELLKSRPENTAKPKGIAYRYINMRADVNKVGEIAPKYRVENSWMAGKRIPESSIRLVSWNATGKVWDELPTKILGNDSDFTYFESVSPGLSSFAITGFALKNSTVNKTQTKQESNKTVQVPGVTENMETPATPGFGFVVGMAAFILIIRFIKR